MINIANASRASSATHRSSLLPGADSWPPATKSTTVTPAATSTAATAVSPKVHPFLSRHEPHPYPLTAFTLSHPTLGLRTASQADKIAISQRLCSIEQQAPTRCQGHPIPAPWVPVR